MNLNWRTVTPSRDKAHWVKGTEIESAVIPDTLSRFVVYSVRTIEWIRDPGHIEGGYMTYDVRYCVRDASTVSDADVRDGKRPAVVASFATLDDLERWVATLDKESDRCRHAA